MKSFSEFKSSLTESEEEIFVYEFDDFELHEDELSESLLGDALAKVKASFQGTAKRIEKAKTKMNQLAQKAMDWKQKASKTKDPVAKSSYDAKIQTADARMQAYNAYNTYQEALATYRQAKMKELEVRQKGRESRANSLKSQ